MTKEEKKARSRLLRQQQAEQRRAAQQRAARVSTPQASLAAQPTPEGHQQSSPAGTLVNTRNPKRAFAAWFGAVGLFASLLTFQQLFVAKPKLEAVPFGSEPSQVVATVENVLWFDMYDVQMATLMGPLRIDTTQDSARIADPLKPLAYGPCEKLLNLRDFQIGQRTNLSMPFAGFERIKSGGQRKLPMNWEVRGNARGALAVAVSYRIKAWGYFPIVPRLYDCREVELARDSDGKIVVLPYP